MAYFLKKSGFSVELTIVSSIHELRNKAIEVYEQDKTETFIVFGTDSEIYELSRLSFSSDQRKYIFPAQNSDGTRILGSKVGLYKHLKKLDIPHPRTEVAHNLGELKQVSSYLDFPIFVKADVGSGGKTVKHFKSHEQLLKEGIDQIWFPVVAQQEVKSKEISVEAAYFKGQLLFWIYSEFVETEDKYAASITRKYIEPKNKKFVEILTELGESVELHGFVNSTFFIGPDGEYLLIEADTRPNAWHHLYFQFEIDFYGLVMLASQGEKVIAQYPKNLPRSGLIMKNKTRHIFKALKDKKLLKVLSISLDSSYFHKKNWARTADSDQPQALVFLRVLTYSFAVICFRAFPESFRIHLRKNKLPARILGRFLS